MANTTLMGQLWRDVEYVMNKFLLHIGMSSHFPVDNIDNSAVGLLVGFR
jgi:hypothetical protein